MCKIKFHTMLGEVPDYFEKSEGISTLETVADLIEDQAKTELCKWYKLQSRYSSPVNGKILDEFDFRNWKRNEAYLAMFTDCAITDVRVAMGAPDFENFDWPNDLRYNCASLIIAFFAGDKIAGIRVVLATKDGRIAQIHDFGMGTEWRRDELLIQSIPAILAKYSGVKK